MKPVRSLLALQVCGRKKLDDAFEFLAFLNPLPLPVESVSVRQFKLQLFAAGLLDQVG